MVKRWGSTAVGMHALFQWFDRQTQAYLKLFIRIETKKAITYMSTIQYNRTSSLKPLTRGVHHLALNTSDMKMTVDFYHNVLGMPLVHALRVPAGVGVGSGNRGNPPYENLRHYFFDMGGDGLLAFFELPKEVSVVADRNSIAAMQHCSFAVSEAHFEGVQRRLHEAGVSFVGPIEVGFDTLSVYFIDPNDIRLEFTCQRGDGDQVRVMSRWTQTADEIMEELQTLTDDASWLDRITKHLAS